MNCLAVSGQLSAVSQREALLSLSGKYPSPPAAGGEGLLKLDKRTLA